MDDFGGILFMLIMLAFGLFIIVSLWKVFEKAGQPGWGILIPIYNILLLLKIAGKPGWWILLYIIPLVNFVIAIIVSIEIAKNFGKDAAFGIGLAFLGIIFYPILAFGSAQYLGAGQN
ncbi:MAG: DUF5684 domain-containing protein [Ignavibacteriaceae bacterium]|jgi:hypothetical protein